MVHARGTSAHGYFQCYANQEDITCASFLRDPEVKTPVFVRFSTVLGGRGSPDTTRDVRGFATRFYTQDGNFDLVGNNIPVFFVQDAIKFPDIVHAAKPEPHNEIPSQGATGKGRGGIMAFFMFFVRNIFFFYYFYYFNFINLFFFFLNYKIN